MPCPWTNSDVTQQCCQHVHVASQGTWEERLASYFAHQIRTDPSTVYGDGFKLALEAYQNSRDLPALIAHVERAGQFPV